jgi:multicomponent Na+:H+ antiporter subunit D
MLAYSSVANMGYIMLGVGLCASTTLGLTPAMMHILNHALMKACMFLVAGAFIYKADLWNISEFQGLGRKMPYTCIAFLLAALAMIGMPPSVGFVTKWYLIIAALEAKQFVFVGVIFVSTLLMVLYFWRVIEHIYIRVADEERKETEIDEIPRSMLIPVLVFGSLCFIMGIVWLMEIPLPLLNEVNAMFGLRAVPR